MENHNAGNAFPAETEGLQRSGTVEMAVGEEKKLGKAGGGDDRGGVAVSVAASSGEADFRVKRKRGRPKKQQGEVQRQEFMMLPEYSSAPPKRGRGRPRGSGKWQTLAASLGGIAGDSTAGSHFTPYTIGIQAGENIVQKIWSFSQMVRDSICILSASGTVSSAEILLPTASHGGILRYEGHFTLIYLNGSHTYDEKRGGKICLLSVQLANHEGRFYGGAVGGSLIAAGPTHLVVASFRQNIIRKPLRIRPQRVGPQKPKHDAVAVAAHAGNGKPAEAEGKGCTGMGGNQQEGDEVAMQGGNKVNIGSPHEQAIASFSRPVAASDVEAGFGDE